MITDHGTVAVSLPQLQALLALEECRSFTAASAQLHLTQSAVSRAIGALERNLGAPVAHRGRSGVNLTSLGRQVAAHARIVVSQLDEIDRLVPHAEVSVRIGGIASAMTEMISDVARQFEASWPRARAWPVRGEDDELAAWFSTGTIDVAVSTWAPGTFLRTSGTRDGDIDPESSEHRERPDQYFALLPVRHRLTAGDDVDIQELVDDGLADPGGSCGPELKNACAANGVAWEPAHLVRDASTALAMTAAGICVSVLPALALPRSLPAGLVTRPLRPALHRTVHLYARNSPQARHVIDLLDEWSVDGIMEKPV